MLEREQSLAPRVGGSESRPSVARRSPTTDCTPLAASIATAKREQRKGTQTFPEQTMKKRSKALTKANVAWTKWRAEDKAYVCLL